MQDVNYVNRALLYGVVVQDVRGSVVWILKYRARSNRV